MIPRKSPICATNYWGKPEDYLIDPKKVDACMEDIDSGRDGTRFLKDDKMKGAFVNAMRASRYDSKHQEKPKALQENSHRVREAMEPISSIVDENWYSEARSMAADWHSGQWSGLYKLSCGMWDKWTKEDVEEMILETKEVASTEYDYNYTKIIDGLRRIKLALSSHVRESFKEDVLDRPTEFRYKMLGRFIADTEYYLDNPSQKHLWSGDAISHADNMLELYNSLSEKPEWLSRTDLTRYRKELYSSVGKKLNEGKKSSPETKDPSYANPWHYCDKCADKKKGLRYIRSSLNKCFCDCCGDYKLCGEYLKRAD